MAEKAKTEAVKQSKVLIVDDHPIVRRGLALLVNQNADLTVCGEADNTVDALQTIEATSPDVVIVDLSLKDSSGLDLIKDMNIRYPKLPVLVLSMREEAFYAERALRAGAEGYITKAEGTAFVVEGLHKVLNREVYLSPKMASRVLQRLVPGREGAPGSVMERLTDRELQIFEMIGTGLTTSEIAKKLHLSVKTIESHREHIKEKLKLENATNLLKQAIQWVQSQGGSQ